MTQDKTSAFKEYIETVTTKGMERAEKVYPGDVQADDECFIHMKSFVDMVREAYDYSKVLSTGDLSAEVSRLNFIAMPSKALQANLKHLVWQTQQIKEGDLNQRINFLGDFSNAFNSLIDALKEKRELEKKVAENENRLRTITSVLGDGVIVTDVDTVITFCNPEACSLLKLSADKLLGAKLHETVHVQHHDGKRISESEKFLFNTINEGAVFRSDKESFTKSDGQIFPVSISCTPIKEGNRITGTVMAFRDITEQKKYQESLEYINKILKIQSTTDHLTGLYNRQYFNEQLSKEISKAKREKTKLAFIIFDIDKFKSINDTFGHTSGDCVLKDISKIVGKKLREYDVLARWGGEEFVILLPESTKNDGVLLAERIRKSIEEYKFSIDRQVTCSFGVTEYLKTEKEKDMINRADEALYRAKESGRNRVVS